MERPILFSGEMVRAILEGKKTQNRRVIKPQPTINWHYRTWCDSQTYAWTTCHPLNVKYQNQIQKVKCPYGQPGDILWVRETWCDAGVFGYAYRATDSLPIGVNTWRPAIHKPRKAARLFLQVKDVRVERLQDITEEDARAEGVKTAVWYMPYGKDEDAHIDISGLPGYPDQRASYRNGFATIWDSINAKRGYGWDTNPWVWVIEFEIAS